MPFGLTPVISPLPPQIPTTCDSKSIFEWLYLSFFFWFFFSLPVKNVSISHLCSLTLLSFLIFFFLQHYYQLFFYPQLLFIFSRTLIWSFKKKSPIPYLTHTHTHKIRNLLCFVYHSDFKEVKFNVKKKKKKEVGSKSIPTNSYIDNSSSSTLKKENYFPFPPTPQKKILFLHP